MNRASPRRHWKPAVLTAGVLSAIVAIVIGLSGGGHAQEALATCGCQSMTPLATATSPSELTSTPTATATNSQTATATATESATVTETATETPTQSATP